MRLVDRYLIRLRFQKTAAITEHNCFQVKFQGVPVHEDHRREINVRNRVAVELQRSGQGFCGFVERPGVESEVVYRNVVSAQQGPSGLIFAAEDSWALAFFVSLRSRFDFNRFRL